MKIKMRQILVVLFSLFVCSGFYILVNNIYSSLNEISNTVVFFQDKLEIRSINDSAMWKQYIRTLFEINDRYWQVANDFMLVSADSNSKVIEINEKLRKAENEIKLLEDSLNSKKDTEIFGNSEEILRANLFITNLSRGVLGSGTHIKIAGKSYILTCHHLIDKKTDLIYARDNDNSYYKMNLVLGWKSKDLAVFELVTLGAEIPHLEIADREPEKGDVVYAVGNPDGMEDSVTEGCIVNKIGSSYLISNTIYFGNSGGALIRNNKIVGVNNLLFSLPVDEGSGINHAISYGGTVRLNVIHMFMVQVYKALGINETKS